VSPASATPDPSEHAAARPPGRAGGSAAPAADYFDVMARYAGEHWWYRARRDLIAALLKDRVPAGADALDVGCGTGEILDLLVALGARSVAGTDVERAVLDHARARTRHGRVVRSSAERLPVRSTSVDLLTSLEVIEHLEDDVRALREYHRVLRPGGRLLVTVPAYQALWSDHDTRAGHYRRYRAAQLEAVLDRAGFELERCTYYFSFLAPAAFVVRRTPMGRVLGDTDEESSDGPMARRILGWLSLREQRWLAAGRDMPFGLSIAALAHRRDNPPGSRSPGV